MARGRGRQNDIHRWRIDSVVGRCRSPALSDDVCRDCVRLGGIYRDETALWPSQHRASVLHQWHVRAARFDAGVRAPLVHPSTHEMKSVHDAFTRFHAPPATLPRPAKIALSPSPASWKPPLIHASVPLKMPLMPSHICSKNGPTFPQLAMMRTARPAKIAIAAPTGIRRAPSSPRAADTAGMTTASAPNTAAAVSTA